MRLGRLDFGDRTPVLLAPLAGYTDAAFRAVCRRFGADLTYTEMVSADGLTLARRVSKGFRKTIDLLAAEEDDHPLGAQLFGKDPARLAEACRIAVGERRIETIDLNAGCPVRKVVNSGHGVALMRDPPLLGRIVAALRAATDLPLTVKLRSGAETINVVECARICEREGADAVIVHPRTRAQMFGGRAHWPLIAEVKQALRAPVVGNGDVTSAELALRLREETGCDAVMIGRGAVARPWLFAQVRAAFAGEPPPPDLDGAGRLALLRELGALLEKTKGPARAGKEIRKFALYFTKGFPGAAAARQAIAGAATMDAMLERAGLVFLADKKGDVDGRSS
jgi:nifR3 family TIM-barrel protein